jgi:hypothetical protein
MKSNAWSKLASCVQPLQRHNEPSSHRRAVPRRQSLCRQPRPDAGRVSGLSGPGGPQRRRWHRNGNHAVGHAAAARALHEYVELVTGRDAIKMLREQGEE